MTYIPTRAPGLTLWDGAICLYLALPTLVFCTWFRPAVAALLVAAVVCGLIFSLKQVQWTRGELPSRTVGWLALLSIAWVSLGGAGHFFYANFDWLTRDAILRDLAHTGWPPSYPTTEAHPLILRAPLGYFLPAAVVGALAGLHAADMMLFAWTSLGFFLLLAAAMPLFTTTKQRVVCLLVLLLFSGMDLAGYALVRGAIPVPGEHLEWWAGFAQYSANTTLLAWVPNHALPAWLTTIVIIRHWRQRELAMVAPVFGACVPLWSPLAALGTVPFFLAGIDWRRDLPQLLRARVFLPLALVALVSARYLSIGSQHIPGGWLLALASREDVVLNLYLLLCLLEFGLLCMVLARLRAFGLQVAIAAALLCVLPLYRFGYGNDIVMRASIPALLVLAIASAKALVSPGPRIWRGTLATLLAIGALGALQEPIRALLGQRWQPTGLSLVEVSERLTGGRGEAAMPTTYVSHLDQPDLAWMLRDPSQVTRAEAATAASTAGDGTKPTRRANGDAADQ